MKVPTVLLTIGLCISAGAPIPGIPEEVVDIIPVVPDNDLPHEFSVKPE
ncbi:hypothetical protein M1I95_02580 [Rossellomorea marisflavi]|nr:hypothetical protein [Rossellomorea marisflavi]UTE73454.1 hypothetical protein M1I95_02580 [Rossellomorea marisflavi]